MKFIISKLSGPKESIFDYIQSCIPKKELFQMSLKNFFKYKNNSKFIVFGLPRLRFNIRYLYLGLIYFCIPKKKIISIDNPVINRSIENDMKPYTYSLPTGSKYVRVGIGSPLGSGYFPMASEYSHHHKSQNRWLHFKKSNNLKVKQIKKIPKKLNNVGIILQKPFDASLGSLDFLRPFNHGLWAINSLFKVKNEAKNIHIFYHPLQKGVFEKLFKVILTFVLKMVSKKCFFYSEKFLNKKNINFDLIFTFSSATCFDAVLMGYPVICCNKNSMGYKFFPNNFEEACKTNITNKQVNNWFRWLSFTEFSLDELKSVEFVKHYIK